MPTNPLKFSNLDVRTVADLLGDDVIQKFRVYTLSNDGERDFPGINDIAETSSNVDVSFIPRTFDIAEIDIGKAATKKVFHAPNDKVEISIMDADFTTRDLYVSIVTNGLARDAKKLRKGQSVCFQLGNVFTSYVIISPSLEDGDNKNITVKLDPVACDDVSVGRDLRVTVPSVDNSVVAIGDPLLLSFALNFTGNDGSATIFTNRFFLSSDNVLNPAVDDQLLSNIVTISSTTIINDLAINIPANVSPGNYYLIIQTDANNSVQEDSETNNTTSIFIEVIGTSGDCNDINACNYDVNANTNTNSGCIYRGNSCNDNDPLTSNDQIQSNCQCEGTESNDLVCTNAQQLTCGTSISINASNIKLVLLPF